MTRVLTRDTQRRDNRELWGRRPCEGRGRDRRDAWSRGSWRGKEFSPGASKKGSRSTQSPLVPGYPHLSSAAPSQGPASAPAPAQRLKEWVDGGPGTRCLEAHSFP